jgi:hypothetical protein
MAVLFGGDVVLDTCSFVDNIASGDGGAINIGSTAPGSASEVSIRHCRFIRNQADIAGGALNIAASAISANTVTVEESLFFGNRAPIGAAVANFDQMLTLRACTFVENTVILSSVSSGVIHLENNGSQPTTIDRCIISFNDGAALGCSFGGNPVVSCSDAFGNTEDDLCGQDGGNNFELDPLFCARDQENFGISEESPCAPGHSPGGCGLIGAFPSSCIAAISPTSWGAIKHGVPLRARESTRR